MTQLCTTNSGDTDVALLNQTLSDLAGIAQQELACVALQQVHCVLCCREPGADNVQGTLEPGAERFATTAWLHFCKLGTCTVPALALYSQPSPGIITVASA